MKRNKRTTSNIEFKNQIEEAEKKQEEMDNRLMKMMEEEEEKMRQEELTKKELQNEKELEKIIKQQKDKDLDSIQLDASISNQLPSESYVSESMQSRSVQREMLKNRKMTPDFEKQGFSQVSKKQSKPIKQEVEDWDDIDDNLYNLDNEVE